MEILNLKANNLKSISLKIIHNRSYIIAGLSGSGKTTFCREAFNESIKRIVTLLPKPEYQFLFSNCINSNFSATEMKELPLIFFLEKSSFITNPRSTIGTHTGIFKKIRSKFADDNALAPEIFSFNNPTLWCEKCKGR